jgi:hypothetical protein
MKWGVRRNNVEGVSARTNREANKDAREYARAKMFYGEGAGTRRKLIKAKVDQKSKQDPNYKKAFDHHLGRQDMGKHAEKARGERRGKDRREGVRKTANSVNRALNGPFAGSAAIAIVGAGAAYAKNNNLGAKAADFARKTADSAKLRRDVQNLLKDL